MGSSDTPGPDGERGSGLTPSERSPAAERIAQDRTARGHRAPEQPAEAAQQDPAPDTAPVHRPRPTTPVVTGTAAPRATGGAETAATVDAPTSSISRSQVPSTSMPDLSTVSHPAPAREDSEARPRPTISVGSRRGRGPLRAAMQLRSIDPWSTLKVSLLLSAAMFLVWMIAVAIIYLVLDGMGVWDRLNTGVTDILDSGDEATLIGPGQVFGVAAILGIINIVLFTAMATIGAFIYNMSADAVGGVEVTLADRD